MTEVSDLAATDGSRSSPAEVAIVLAERARALAAPVNLAGRDAGEPHLITEVGDTQIAVPASRIRGVSSPGQITPVPACRAIVGLVAVGGDLVPAAVLADLLGLPSGRESGDATAQRLVVIDDGAHRLGLLVSDVVDLADLRGAEPVAGTDGPGGGRLVTGRCGSAFVLDVDAVLADERLAAAGPDQPGQDRTDEEDS